MLQVFIDTKKGQISFVIHVFNICPLQTLLGTCTYIMFAMALLGPLFQHILDNFDQILGLSWAYVGAGPMLRHARPCWGSS